ncbi:hypothetical protein AXG93_291s1050 [Marchantia polymorpha subsp. ruderalis]|uniref:Uncharacterized protein n=1 Tax=Marchantia polymorpha subsp. ruderalis TaxID=1480154 RepID=A0A176VFZ9_MARPO|nr:hypothetical protein AXG93_291s1050 [Marchantia polymorpha subsp. ruderalis]
MAREVAESCIDSVNLELVHTYCMRLHPTKPELAARRIEAIGFQVGLQLAESSSSEAITEPFVGLEMFLRPTALRALHARFIYCRHFAPEGKRFAVWDTVSRVVAMHGDFAQPIYTKGSIVVLVSAQFVVKIIALDGLLEFPSMPPQPAMDLLPASPLKQPRQELLRLPRALPVSFLDRDTERNRPPQFPAAAAALQAARRGRPPRHPQCLTVPLRRRPRNGNISAFAADTDLSVPCSAEGVWYYRQHPVTGHRSPSALAVAVALGAERWNTTEAEGLCLTVVMGTMVSKPQVLTGGKAVRRERKL